MPRMTPNMDSEHVSEQALVMSKDHVEQPRISSNSQRRSEERSSHVGDQAAGC